MKTPVKYFLIGIISFIEFNCGSNENLTHGLIGKWKWTYLCGGITGACGYADENDTRTLEFTKDKMIETSHDGLVVAIAYSISSQTNHEDYTEYVVQFENGSNSRIKATKNTLEIENGDTWTGYKK
jgi:hypothetical protein